MKALVTGATGFIGYELARQLAEMGVRPRLLVRRPWRGPLLASLDAELVQGDLDSPDSLRRAVDGVDTVFHLAARAAFEAYALVRPSIVGGSTALMDACVAAGVECFVYSSSLLVYDSQTRPIDATTPARPRSGYGRAKVEAEAALAARAGASGMRLAVVRLPHVYGARDLLFERVRRGRVLFPGRFDAVFAHLHVEDSARVLIAAARGWSGVAAVGDRRPTTWEEFFQVISTHYPRLRVTRVPRWLALAGTRLLAPLHRWSRHPSLITPDTVVSWSLNLPVDPDLLWSELDLAPRFPSIHDGIPAVLDECVAFRWLHPIADRS